MTEANDWNANVIKEFRENGGKVSGMFEGFPMILLHTTGAKSGKARIIPLVYLADGDRVFVFASKGGADDNPDWYHNLLAYPEIEAEIGTERFAATAVVLQGAERDEYYAKQVALLPNFGDYERKTKRVIPVVELRRSAA